MRQQADALAMLQRDGWRVTKRNGEENARRADAKGARFGDGRSETVGVGRLSQTRAGDGAELEARTEVNLRGMTGDEATFALIRALDSAFSAELPFVRIIHGKGTGALRARVTEVLRDDRRVAAFSLAPPQQGGNGVTIAELKT